MKPRAVDFVSYNVTDMARAEAFYRDVLGLDVPIPWGGPGRLTAKASGRSYFTSVSATFGLMVMSYLGRVLDRCRRAS